MIIKFYKDMAGYPYILIRHTYWYGHYGDNVREVKNEK